MNIQQAFEILDINLNETKISDITPEYIKKKYYKQALINHPDKNGNTYLSTEKFQKISEAYDYLLNELNDVVKIEKIGLTFIRSKLQLLIYFSFTSLLNDSIFVILDKNKIRLLILLFI